MYVIIESPNKIKKLKAVLPADYIATAGHFRDLPEKELGIDPDDNFKPFFETTPDKQNIYDKLKNIPSGSDIYIATDPDREGFAIGMHVYEIVKKHSSNIKRLEIRAITKAGVEEAMRNVVSFDKANHGTYNAFLGRRVSDRVVGYMVSPLACNTLKGKFSVGRVQSPGVRLVVDREREILAFKPEKFWNICLLLEKNGTDFKAYHNLGDIKTKADVDRILNIVKSAPSAIVETKEDKETQQNPKAPFTTVDLQASGSSQLKFSPEDTMKLAQGLFEHGLISYHRTDSSRIDPSFITEIRTFIKDTFSKEYVPNSPKEYKSKNSQAEAHEAIRPTHLHALSEISDIINKEGLSKDHEKLYALIYKRAVASQMANALYDSTKVTFDCEKEKFSAKGRVLKFDGFLKLYSEEQSEEEKSKKEGAEDEGQKLPLMTLGESVNKKDTIIEDKETKPPFRYSEATLVKKLESLGIGRPSTTASIVAHIKKRGYVQLKRDRLYPTDTGYTVVDYLNEKFSWIIDYSTTKAMEEHLDMVEEGRAKWQDFVSDIYNRILLVAPAGFLRNNNSGGGSYTPSEKQLKYAAFLEMNTGLKMPSAAKTDSKELSQWIEKAKVVIDKTPKDQIKRDPNDNSTYTPTTKQIDYAKNLAAKSGKTLPPEYLTDGKKLSSWIDSAKESLPPSFSGGQQYSSNNTSRTISSLSPKQMDIINKNASDTLKKKVANGDLAAGKDFIDKYFKELEKKKSQK